MNYSERALAILKTAGAKEGDTLLVRGNDGEQKGVLMPHHQFSDPDVIVIKLKSGYNVGIRLKEGVSVAVQERAEERARPVRHAKTDAALPTVAIIGTGGTIASYVDYRTGAVHPALSADDLIAAVPEISSICNVRAKVLYSIFSENMDSAAWVGLAQAIVAEIEAGADGVIVPHGTDTMGFTSAALSFMLEGLDRPVVLVGAQRSSDRPSSDAYTNLVAAARFCATADASGVFVLMHEGPSDTSALVHLGTRVRKMHSSRRDAFHSVNATPVAKISFEGSVEFLSDHPVRGTGKLVLRDCMEPKVAMLQFYPGMDSESSYAFITAHRGVVLAGSGLGHVSAEMVGMLAKAASNGVTVAMTTQCLYGQVNLNVYATGRDLINAGVMPCGDMLPETALVKLMWVLAQTADASEVRRLMTSDLRGELSSRREIDG
jgi:glutamyl-tRNA(Gln) amidotransferase subunit D